MLNTATEQTAQSTVILIAPLNESTHDSPPADTPATPLLIKQLQAESNLPTITSTCLCSHIKNYSLNYIKHLCIALIATSIWIDYLLAWKSNFPSNKVLRCIISALCALTHLIQNWQMNLITFNQYLGYLKQAMRFLRYNQHKKKTLRHQINLSNVGIMCYEGLSWALTIISLAAPFSILKELPKQNTPIHKISLAFNHVIASKAAYPWFLASLIQLCPLTQTQKHNQEIDTLRTVITKKLEEQSHSLIHHPYSPIATRILTAIKATHEPLSNEHLLTLMLALDNNQSAELQEKKFFIPFLKRLATYATQHILIVILITLYTVSTSPFYKAIWENNDLTPAQSIITMINDWVFGLFISLATASSITHIIQSFKDFIKYKKTIGLMTLISILLAAPTILPSLAVMKYEHLSTLSSLIFIVLGSLFDNTCFIAITLIQLVAWLTFKINQIRINNAHDPSQEKTQALILKNVYTKLITLLDNYSNDDYLDLINQLTHKNSDPATHQGLMCGIQKEQPWTASFTFKEYIDTLRQSPENSIQRQSGEIQQAGCWHAKTIIPILSSLLIASLQLLPTSNLYIYGVTQWLIPLIAVAVSAILAYTLNRPYQKKHESINTVNEEEVPLLQPIGVSKPASNTTSQPTKTTMVGMTLIELLIASYTPILLRSIMCIPPVSTLFKTIFGLVNVDKYIGTGLAIAATGYASYQFNHQ